MKSVPRTPGRSRRTEFLIFGSPLIGEEEIQEVEDVLRSGWLGTGPRVAQFEEAFRELKGADHAVALNSCTAALHIAMHAVGVGEGDEVITTPLTFAATANAIVHAGARPVFADCDRRTMNIDPEAVAAAVTPRTKAIVPVHFAGRPCDMRRVMAIADQHDLTVIEDCAHAVEAEYHDRPVGTIGDVGCFSFYVTKNVVTGEGGMLVTNSAEIADRAKVLSLHGMTRDAWRRFSDEGYRHYQVVEAGFKYNMMDLQAAIGLHQLERLEQNARRRLEIWERYDEAFDGLPCETPLPAEPGTRHARHLYTLLVDVEALGVSRDEVLDRLTEQNIGAGVHYVALHLHPFYSETLDLHRGDFPEAEYVSDRTISIPLSAKLTDDDVEDVIWAVRTALEA
ncbi:MAG: DegT/DnrJ/EryC1/StrS family aminotransferase [Candidatus Limnocylindria bacterium]